ncbi:putative NAD(P)H dehydrogenase subunit CRR3 chloroplastic, partial [Bienertia sinuspersici]
MVLSGCISITKPVIPLASLPTNSSHRSPPRKPPKISTCQPSNTQQIQPSAAEIERAIGAGIYRDHDPATEKSIFDAVLSNSIGKTEGKTEQALREAGEWLNKQTEKTTRSSGKKILEAMFFWIAPAWLLLLLLATGTVKLPFSFSALDDLI